MTRDTFDRFAPSDRGRFGDREAAGDRPTRAARSDLVDLTLIVRHTTERGVLVSETEDGTGQWLPLAHVEVAPTGTYLWCRDKYGRRWCAVAIVTLPRWLAQERGLT